ncbi:carbon-nitrogen hydrolase family protein [bacterium]|nr:carbon-nitrogen hydrolase family protein [bacterium]
MARYVKIAATFFSTTAERGGKESGEIVRRETAERLEALEDLGLDLIVLCEGVEAFGQTPETAEVVGNPGPFLSLYSEHARKMDSWIAASVKLREGDHVYNSLAFIDRQGAIAGVYHKTFLTETELNGGLTPGPGPRVFETEIGRLGGAICFDLNYHPLRMGYKPLRPDILCFASMYHGGLMQQMWAYDCRACFVAALPFIGGGILDPFGRSVEENHCYTQGTPFRAAIGRVNLDRAMVHLDRNRGKFPDILRKYKDEIEISIPANVGPALILSLSDRISAQDVVKEFQLQLLDDYFEESIEANQAARPVDELPKML